MKRHLLLTLFASILSQTIAFAQIAFHTTYTGADSDFGSSISLCKEGGYILAGYTKSYGVGGNDACMIKTNGNGGTIWFKSFGGSGEDKASSVKQTADSGFIFTGTTTSFGAGGTDVYLVKTDKDGNIVWQRTFGGSGDDGGSEVILTADGGYAIVGSNNSLGLVSDKVNGVYVIKTDANGDSLWTKVFAGESTTSSDAGSAIFQTRDKGYIITGSAVQKDSTNSSVYLLKLDSNGIAGWNKLIGGPGNEGGSSVQQTEDLGYIITGSTNSFGAGALDPYLIKTDDRGTVQWSRTYGGGTTDEGIYGQPTADGGYFVMGETGSFAAGIKGFYFIKTDANGDTMWTRSYGDANINIGISGRQAADGGFVLVGYRVVFPGGKPDIYVVKTDANGSSYCIETATATVQTSPNSMAFSPLLTSATGGTVSIPASVTTDGSKVTNICTYVAVSNTENKQNEILLYPNPAQKELTIQRETFKDEKATVYIVNTLGQLTSPPAPLLQERGVASIDVSKLAAGIYFVRIEGEEGVWTGRFVKE